jgi:hypothetical protein
MSQRLSTLRAMYLLSVALTLLHGGASAFALPKTQTAAAGEIAMIGSFPGDGPWSRWGGRWLSLLERENVFELRPVIVSSTRETPICGDVGFNVRAADAKPGILLLRGFSAVKAGPVVAAFNGGRFGKFLLPGERLDLSLGGENSWSLHAFGTVQPTVGAGRGEVELRAFNLFECLCRGSGVLDDGRDAGLLQRMADREPIHIVVVEHEDTRVCWRLAGFIAPVMVIHPYARFSRL